jgi:hypothetical protein
VADARRQDAGQDAGCSASQNAGGPETATAFPGWSGTCAAATAPTNNEKSGETMTLVLRKQRPQAPRGRNVTRDPWRRLSRRRRLSDKARHALELLAVDQHGLTETLLRTYGFTLEMLAGLVRTGLATSQHQTVKAGSKTIEVVRIRITEAGRNALAAEE